MTRKFRQAKRNLGDTLAEHGQSRTVLVIRHSKEPDAFPPAHILDQFGKQHRRICSIRDGDQYRNYSLAGDSNSALDEFLEKSKKLGAWGMTEKVILRISSPHPVDLWADTMFAELSDTPAVQSLPGGHVYMEAFPSACETARIAYDRAIARNKEQIDTEPADENRTTKSKRKFASNVPKRSWTQPDLDEAIREYKAKRSSTYTDLLDGVNRGRSGAIKSARKIFGRNAIVRALGVKSPAMVTNSPVWQQIADELRLRGQSRKSRPANDNRIGMEIALEEKGVASSETPVDQAIRHETLAMVTRAMPTAEADATIEKLQRGDITDDEARELVDVLAQQQQDERTRKVRHAR